MPTTYHGPAHIVSFPRQCPPDQKNVNIYKKVLTGISGCYLLKLLAATDEQPTADGSEREADRRVLR